MKQPALLNSQFFAQLAAIDKTTSRTPQTQRAYWWHAIVIGSIAQVSLFAALPLLAPGRVIEVFDRPIEVNFVAWQTPKATPEPETKPRPQPPKAKQKPPKPKPIVEPEPAPKPRPQPSLEAEDRLEKSQPPTPQVSEPQDLQAETSSEAQTPTRSAQASESLPTPIPEYMLSEYPSYAHEDPGSYPFEMRSLGREAVVGLDILIDKDGKVRNIKITQSQGALFDQAALDKINRSTFLPGKSDGKPVVVLLHEKVTFKLK